MRKTKKHFKKNRFNKTFKGGAVKIQPNPEVSFSNVNNDDKNNNQEVVGLVTNSLKSGVGKVYGVVKDAVLNAAGLEEKKTDENDEEKDKEEEEPSLFSRAAATVLEPVKDFAESALVKESVTEMAKDTVDALKDNLEIFNDALNKPEVKEEIIEGIKTASVYGDALVEASKEPINNFAENIAEEVPNIAAAVVPGAVKVGTDFAGAIPGVGAVIDVLKAANDGAAAFEKTVEATTNIIDSAADTINETKENYDKVMEELEEKKQLANKISNRTTQSINEFTSPLDKFKNQTEQAAGKRKTKRRLIKRKVKSKRVRFAF